MGSEDTDLMEEGGGGRGGGGGEGEIPIGGATTSVTCSICFEAVVDNGGRSWAKLHCDHMFHLDCIGSAFNAKGLMQCPNCRKIEKGQWLYANGCRSCPELSIDDWTHEIYDLSYSEVPYGFHWCPFGGLTRVSSSFEERELPSTGYHDLLSHHAIFAEHTAPSVAHSCPYFAYLQPLQPSSSNSIEGIADDPSFGHHWSGLSGPSDVSTSRTFPVVDLHYQTWDHSSSSFSVGVRADQAPVSSATVRSSRSDSDGQPRSGSFAHPVFLSHGPGPRAGSSVVSPAVPPYPGSNTRSHDRAIGQSYHQQQQTGTPNMRLPMFPTSRRSSGPRAPIGPVVSSSERTNGYYVFPSGSSARNIQQQDNSLRNHFYAWERDRFAPFPLISLDRESSWWAPIHQAANGPESGTRSSSVWQSHGSERTSPSLAENPQQRSHPTGSLHPFI